jgi:hypothetical protein
MKVLNYSADSFELQIQNYHFENHFNVLFNSDWLDVTINIIINQKLFSVEIENFLVEDLDRIIAWLSDTNSKKKLYFVDPNFIMLKAKRVGISFLKVIYYTSETSFIAWDIELTEKNKTELLDKFNEDLKAFPCRCNQEHPNN